MKLTLELTTSQLGLILYSYELFFSNLYSLVTENKTTSTNIFRKFYPLLVPGCLSGMCYGLCYQDYKYCYLQNEYELNVEDCYIAMIRRIEDGLHGYPKTMYEYSFPSYRKYFLNMIEQDTLLKYFEWVPEYDHIYEMAKEYIEKDGIFLEVEQINNTIQILDLYASIHLVKNVNANDIAGEIELLSYLHSVQCSRRLASVIDEIMGDKVAIGDIVIMKNLDTGEIEKFILAENRADYEDKVASDTTIMMAVLMAMIKST